MCWSPLIHIDGTLNNARYISGEVRLVALSFIQALRNPTFQQYNARTQVVGTVRIFLNTANVKLLPWPSRSPDILPIENVWSMFVKRLTRHHKLVTTIDELRF
ncbi:transposable element Tcb1 transposase [Trichonephila clavipes]|nr:transposable element Tcb1 transposase [Trichonephila clavipes]